MFTKVDYEVVKPKFQDLSLTAHKYGIDYLALVKDEEGMVEYIIVDYPEELLKTLDDEGFEDEIYSLLGVRVSVGGMFSLPASALLDFSQRSEVILDDTNLRR